MLESIEVDIIGSSAAPCKLSTTVLLTDTCIAQEGYVLAVRVLEHKDTYNVLEGTDGQFHKLKPGMTFVGALGDREALKGYRGQVPARVQTGDRLNVLNMGGIIGECTSPHPMLGLPLTVEVLGSVAAGDGRPAAIQDHALAPLEHLEKSAPIVAITGTAMDTGKTRAAAAIIEGLVALGYRVAAAKLTGAALLRDIRAMEANGAVAVASFADAGIVSSARKANIIPAAKAVLQALNEVSPDVIVIELGAGILGHYGVEQFLLDDEIPTFVKAHVVAATDLAGAWAIAHLFETKYHQKISTIVGPVTDNGVGSDYIQQTLGIRAHNAMQDPAGLAEEVAQHVGKPAARKESSRPVFVS